MFAIAANIPNMAGSTQENSLIRIKRKVKAVKLIFLCSNKNYNYLCYLYVFLLKFTFEFIRYFSKKAR